MRSSCRPPLHRQTVNSNFSFFSPMCGRFSLSGPEPAPNRVLVRTDGRTDGVEGRFTGAVSTGTVSLRQQHLLLPMPFFHEPMRGIDRSKLSSLKRLARPSRKTSLELKKKQKEAGNSGGEIERQVGSWKRRRILERASERAVGRPVEGKSVDPHSNSTILQKIRSSPARCWLSDRQDMRCSKRTYVPR